MPSPRVLWTAAGGSALALGVVLWAAEPPPPPKRVPWTTSKITGSPEPPPPFRAVNPFPKVKLNHPLACVFAPGSDRLFVAEQGGKMVSFRPAADAAPDLFVDLPKELKRIAENPNAKEFESCFGFVFHPQFAAGKREVFVCYTLRGKKGKTGPFDHERNLPDGSRVSRFAVTAADPPRVDPATEEILLTFPQGGHNGCDLHFGPDGMLYFCTGDAADPTPPDPFHTGQDISDLLSSVVRIDVDRKDAGLNYAVPADNPFVGLKVGDKSARPEVWAYGFRNAWRMSFDRATGDLWVGDVGWELWEMVHHVRKGTNHGWSAKEASQTVYPDEPLGPSPITPPVIALSHTQAASMTGGFVYRGKKFPELVGKYVFGDYMTRRIWAATLDGDRLVSLQDLVKPTLRVVAFGQDAAGELYVVDYDAGTVNSLERADLKAASATFPMTLSATGLFSDVKTHAVAPGVYPFTPIARQWQDHATAEHFLALPGTGTVTDHGRPKALGGNIDWLPFRYHFPADGVLVKTISLEMVRGEPASTKRLETQVLHFDGLFWEGYTYAWRDDGTDADLVPKDGAEKTLTVTDPVYGGKHERQWAFHSRVQCGSCHTPWAQVSLAFNPLQLNRPSAGGNQLNDQIALGLLTRAGAKDDDPPRGPFKPGELSSSKRLTDPHDPAKNLDDRARSYLHVNCGHCHRGGGGGAAAFEVHVEANLKGDRGVLDIVPGRGTFDLPDAKLVAPGDPHRSTVFYRAAKFGSGRMPQLGTDLVDEQGVQLLKEWIAGMAESGPHAPRADDRTRSVRAALPTTVAVAEPLARECGNPATPPSRRAEIVAEAAKLKPGPVRDLFDGYLPQTGERKLGASPRPAAILARTGDPQRGKEVYWTPNRMTCHTCHQIDGKGLAVGPDLSGIGKQRTRDHILESLLEPSKVVEPAFQSYILRTADGQTLTGVLVKRDAAGVTLKDAQNKTTTVPAADIEKLSPARESLMPAGLLADLTAQEVADLLAFLAGRTGGTK